ncbi:hypothetical protein L1987_75947 [Smallanthus sonchifolius]|uniref:Uncharacterized protein n=1 Tax=Smallanthus sonchifolius TaxID=185202 RepID=A0ACB9A7H7_9ASTR|nr:hypothetical protein L1987_75947 [Smallanthus sonchifolius]
MDLVFYVYFVDKYVTKQSYIKLDSHDKFHLMLSMYEVEKELTVYATTKNNLETSLINQRGRVDVDDEPHGDVEPCGEEESEYSLSDESYHSRYSTDNEL